MKSNRVPLLKNEDVLIVPVRDDLDDLETKQLESSLLERVSKGDVRGVVIDISSLDFIDLFTARKLVQLINKISLLDVRAVMVGMKPTVALTLTEMEVTFPHVRTALTLEQGLAILKKVR